MTQVSKLFERTELFEEALESVGYRGSWYADHRSGLIRLGPETQRLLPLTASDASKAIPTSQFDLFLHEGDREWIRARRATPNAPGVIRSVLEYRMIGLEGTRWVQAHSLRRIRDDGAAIDGRGMIFDITDLKANGDSVARNPLAPLSYPLNHLAEGVLLAIAAAEQARLPGLAGKLRRIAETTGRLLARGMIFPGRRSVH